MLESVDQIQFGNMYLICTVRSILEGIIFLQLTLYTTTYLVMWRWSINALYMKRILVMTRFNLKCILYKELYPMKIVPGTLPGKLIRSISMLIFLRRPVVPYEKCALVLQSPVRILEKTSLEQEQLLTSKRTTIWHRFCKQPYPIGTVAFGDEGLLRHWRENCR